jgi:transposase-like protein
MQNQSQQSVGAHDSSRAASEPRLAAADKGNGSRPPNPEVEPKAKRRQFSAAYKARILEEVDRSPGQTGAILRREGLYSSHLTSWRKQRRKGTLKALSAKKRGRKGKSEAELENEKLRRENARLQRELERAQVIIDTQKKLAEILGVDLPKIADSNESTEND